MKKISLIGLVLILCLCLCSCKSSDYKNAAAQMDAGEYQQAKEIFENLGEYQDSAEMIKKCDYNIAVGLASNGDYEAANKLFLSLGEYEDSEEKAIECLLSAAEQYADHGQLKEATTALKTISKRPEAQTALSRILVKELEDNYIPEVEQAKVELKSYESTWFEMAWFYDQNARWEDDLRIPPVEEDDENVRALRKCMERANEVINTINEAYSEDILEICNEDIQELVRVTQVSAQTIDSHFSSLTSVLFNMLVSRVTGMNTGNANKACNSALDSIQEVIDRVTAQEGIS